MSLVKINGVDIPTPSDYSVGIQDISKAERNANGTMIKELIATKRKLDLQWKYLTKEQISQIFGLISNNFFTVEYVDPQTNGVKTGTFYSGDRKCGMLDFQNSIPRYKDVQFSLIER